MKQEEPACALEIRLLRDCVGGGPLGPFLEGAEDVKVQSLPAFLVQIDAKASSRMSSVAAATEDKAGGSAP